MRKLLLITLIMLFAISGVAFSAPESSVNTIFDDVTIDTTATASSSVITVKSSGYFGVWYQATSSVGTPDIKLEVTMSPDTTTANFVEPEGMPDIVTNLADETAHVKGISPPPMKYMKIKYTGNGANPADTILNLKLFRQE